VYRKRAGPAPQPLRQPLVRLDVDLGGTVSPNADRAPSALLSADGHGSYTSPSRSFSRGSSIRRTALSCLEPKGQKGPFFSPDGQGVAFNANGKLKKISVRGGPVIQLCDVP